MGAARELIANRADQPCIETTKYRECGFILEAARLALDGEAVAARIGMAMEAPRAVDRKPPAGG